MKTRKLICFALAAVMMLCAVPALAAGNSGWGTTPQYVPESALEMTLSSNMLTLANTTLSITFTNKSKLTNYSSAIHSRWRWQGTAAGFRPPITAEAIPTGDIRLRRARA